MINGLWKSAFGSCLAVGLASACATTPANESAPAAAAAAEDVEYATTVREAAAAGEVAVRGNAFTSDDEGVVCERERITGSRIPVRVCTTAAQRRALAEVRDQQREDLLDHQTRMQGPTEQAPTQR